MSLPSHTFVLSPEHYDLLVDAIGERAETVIPIHQLRRKLCRAYVKGQPSHFSGAIVQPGGALSAEPFGFGAAETLFELLQNVPGWDCVLLETPCAQALGTLFMQAGTSVRYYKSIDYALRQPVAVWKHPMVRLLGVEDLPLLAAAPPELQGDGFENQAALLQDGVVAAGIIDGQMVAIAHTSARTPRYADIAVTTLEAWRNQGISTAAASLVAARLQGTGQIPVWSTGVDNYASQRVAEKLGFLLEGESTYLIPGGGEA